MTVDPDLAFFSHAVGSYPDVAWQGAVDALRRAGGSNFVVLGFGPEPLLIPHSALESHCYVVGPSNSGKTSRVLAPLLSQLVAGGHPVWNFDCKPDHGLCGHIREAARASGRKLHFFSLQPGVPSDFALDIFAALQGAGRTPRQIAELLIGSLGLNQAAEPFFISENAGLLRAGLEQAAAKGKLSFKALAHEMRAVFAAKRYQHGSHAMDVMESLAAIPELNPGKGALPACDLAACIEKPSVVYFALPVTTELKLTSAAVAALVLKTLVVVGKSLALEGKAVRRTFVSIDEFQDIATVGDLASLVSQVRGVGAGISLVLSHQVREQVPEEGGLRELLKTSGVLIVLAPRMFADELQQWSGEKVVWMRSDSHTNGSSTGADGKGSTSESRSTSWTETIRPALELNLIQAVNALDGGGFMVVKGGPPQPAFFPHHVSAVEADRRARRAFPKPVPAAKPVLTLAPQPKLPAPVAAVVALPPSEDPLSLRMQRLWLRVAHTVLLPSLSKTAV